MFYIYTQPLYEIGYRILKYSIIKIIVNKLVSNLLITGMINKYFIIIYTIKFILVVPRLLLGSILYLDVVYLNKIYLFYAFVWLSIIPISYLSLIWLVQQHVLKEKTFLEEKYSVRIINNSTLQVKSDYDVSWLKIWQKLYHVHDITSAVDAFQRQWYFLILRGLTVLPFMISWIFYLTIALKFGY